MFKILGCENRILLIWVVTHRICSMPIVECLRVGGDEIEKTTKQATATTLYVYIYILLQFGDIAPCWKGLLSVTNEADDDMYLCQKCAWLHGITNLDL